MNKLFIGLLMIGSMSSFAATTLFCNAADEGEIYYHEVLKGKAVLNCSSVKIDMNTSSGITKNRKYRVEIDNIGLGLFRVGTSEGVSGLTIFCPTVRKKALGVESFENKKGKIKKGTLNFYGVRVSAGFIAGVDAAVFSNKNAGVCILAGVNALSMGASVSGSHMRITLID